MITPPNLSEGSWLGAFAVAIGAAGAVFGVAAFFFPEPLITLAIGAGFGWALVVSLFVVSGMQRRRIADLDTDVAEWKRRADDWSRAAADASATSRAVAELFRPQAAPPPARKRAVKKASEDE